ncbi:unnamed protein product [Owenia fusiformis]|uniref:Tyr recombinase domain-containing protein n=1 Tax=Owenia fusiformis TaxID=6347 RepID=A0A8J1UT56_OWEFU|nr:unnamed protein product [Owenia fusiformis]
MPTTRGPGKRKTKSPTQATASTSSTQSTQSSQPPKKRSKQQTNNKNKDDGSLIEAVTEAVMSKLSPKLDELFQKSASSAKNDESSSDDSSDEDEIFESGSGRSEIASAISQLVTQDGPRKKTRTLAEPRTRESNYRSQLRDRIDVLMNKSLAPSTKTTYIRAWKKYIDFHKRVTAKTRSKVFPVTSTRLSSFIAHLSLENYASATITTMVSAISYYHKMCNKTDPADSFLIRKILKGLLKASPSLDSRLPISEKILAKLIGVLPLLFTSKYEITLMTAMFSLAYHAFLRLSEFTTGGLASHALEFNMVKIMKKSIIVAFKDYKHNVSTTPFRLHIKRSLLSKICAVRLMKEYVEFRKRVLTDNNQLFILNDGSPVTRQYFCKHLEVAVCANNLEKSKYTSHSFRIGSSTDLITKYKFSEEQVAKMGRWKIKAVKRYIRVNAM